MALQNNISAYPPLAEVPSCFHAKLPFVRHNVRRKRFPHLGSSAQWHESSFAKRLFLKEWALCIKFVLLLVFAPSPLSAAIQSFQKSRGADNVSMRGPVQRETYSALSWPLKTQFCINRRESQKNPYAHQFTYDQLLAVTRVASLAHALQPLPRQSQHQTGRRTLLASPFAQAHHLCWCHVVQPRAASVL